MNVYEMEGFLRGKCLPGDLKVNESNAEYLVRKLNAVSEFKGELTAALATIDTCREIVGCPDGVDLQDWVKQLAAENVAPRQRIAELESRTVKLPEAFYPDGDIDCPLVVNLDDVKEMLTTTGINWEAE